VTTNNDTPQVFSDGASDEADAGPFGRQWRDEADAAWLGWEQAGAADGYPQPPFAAMTEGYPEEPPGYPGYREALGARQEPEYPSGPGYAPLPPDHAGYPAGPEYAPDSGYADNLGYPHEGWDEPSEYRYPPDAQYLGYVPEPGYGRDTVPPLESWSYPPPSLPVGPVGPASSRTAAASGETSDSLTAESLLPAKRSAAGSGWRQRISRVTGGLLRLGESAADMRRRDLINRVRTPVAGGHHRVAVLSLKGGVGKTTTAVGLGATFATLRGDRVIAVDANPDRGTLSDKVRLETAATVRDLLNERDQIYRYADVRAFTTQAPSRLEVLASDRDPAVSVAFSADDYCDAAQVLEHFYSICLTDCGTGLLHSAMAGVLALADQIVVVSSPSVDGARSASATLDWLEAHSCADLVRNGVVVLSVIRPKSKSTVDLDRLEHHFAARCRAVARIPYDPHLEEGAEVDLELLSAETADAYLTLAALVGDGLAWPRRLTSRSALP
jgi:MinD-like ATPase involved in chromosome partitioning or flagellar assembly